MPLRLLPALLCLCLFAALQGVDLHEHRHSHDAQPVHSHVVTAFGHDHAQSHADGVVDDGESKAAARTKPQLPAIVLTQLPQLFDIEVESTPRIHPATNQQLTTGPPPHSRPPSQAPPHASVIV